MSLPFLRAESEETATQAIAFVAVAILTVGLLVMNVSGAIAGSTGTSPLEITIRAALAVVLSGAELLAAVAVVRVMLAPTKLRMILGGIIFIGLAWACIQNGKRAVHLIYPEFKESAALLDAKAGIAGDEAKLINEARGKAIEATPQELAKVRTDIAALKAEQQLMASQSPEKVKEAQSLLIAQGKYFGRVDGIRAELTEAAMRARGEEIAGELTTLGLREEALAAGAVTASASVAAATVNPAVQQAELKDKADKARSAAIWLEVMLWVFEGARSLGLWVYVTTITSKRKAEGDVLYSEDVPPGIIRVDFTEEEHREYERAMEKHKNGLAGAKKAVETKAEKREREARELRQQGKIEASMKEMQKKVSAFLVDRAKGMSIAEVAEKHGTSVAAMAMQYRNYMSDEQFDLLFGFGYKPFTDEPQTLGDFMAPIEPPAAEQPEPEAEPQPEPEIPEPPTTEDVANPPEQTEYGVAIYEPPANDEPEDKDAA